jgi:hypothetical protein
MSVRFCPTCHADVEDTGGFCLLGHSLRVAPIIDSLDEVVADLNQAFANARAEFAQIGGRSTAPEAPPRVAPAPPPIHSAPVVPAPAPAAPAAAAALDEAAPAPTTVSAQPVPPPPSAPRTSRDSEAATVWTAFGEELDVAEAPKASDPISMFAPSPRMDWGPERAAILRRPRLRRPARATA